MSIVGVRAYDLISWNAMLEGLLQMEGGDQILLCEMFPRGSINMSTGGRDGHNPVHPTREGGGQGDPLMPMLFALGQHRALTAIQERMKPGKHVKVDRSGTKFTNGFKLLFCSS